MIMWKRFFLINFFLQSKLPRDQKSCQIWKKPKESSFFDGYRLYPGCAHFSRKAPLSTDQPVEELSGSVCKLSLIPIHFPLLRFPGRTRAIWAGCDLGAGWQEEGEGEEEREGYGRTEEGSGYGECLSISFSLVFHLFLWLSTVLPSVRTLPPLCWLHLATVSHEKARYED